MAPVGTWQVYDVPIDAFGLLNHVLLKWLDLDALRVAYHTDGLADEWMWVVDLGSDFAYGPVVGTLFTEMMRTAMESGASSP